MAESSQGFFRKHWLGTAGVIAGILIPSLWLYLQLVVWKRHGDDLTLTALGIVATLLLWCILVAGIVRYWRDAHRAVDKETEIATVRAECKSLLEGRDRQDNNELNQAQAFAKSANDEARDLKRQLEERDEQIRTLNQQLGTRPVNESAFPLSPLQKEAFDCATKLRQWIAEIGPLATPPLIAGESDEERVRRTEAARKAYRSRLRFGYARIFRNEVMTIYQKFAEENLRDLWLESVMSGIGYEEHVLNAADSLEALAVRQFAPRASELIMNRLNPLITTVQV